MKRWRKMELVHYSNWWHRSEAVAWVTDIHDGVKRRECT